MSLQTNLAAAFLRVVTAINAVNSKAGNLANLTTTDKTNLVSALNELKAGVAAAATINDASSGTSATWSSSKIQTQINAAITALISGADGANDTLKELADRITALAQADAGLLSFTQAQTLTIAQQQQGCGNLGIGDPSASFVTAIEANLAAGL